MHPNGSFAPSQKRPSRSPQCRTSKVSNSPPPVERLMQRTADYQDISATGLFLVTRERFAPGDMVFRSLRAKWPPEGTLSVVFRS